MTHPSTLAAKEGTPALSKATANRQAMPTVASVVDDLRRIFGSGIKCVYAREGNKEIGRLPDNGMETPPRRPR